MSLMELPYAMNTGDTIFQFVPRPASQFASLTFTQPNCEKALRLLKVSELLRESGPLVLPPPGLSLLVFIEKLFDQTEKDTGQGGSDGDIRNSNAPND